jgi:hypothetical protein
MQAVVFVAVLCDVDGWPYHLQQVKELYRPAEWCSSSTPVKFSTTWHLRCTVLISIAVSQACSAYLAKHRLHMAVCTSACQSGHS